MSYDSSVFIRDAQGEPLDEIGNYTSNVGGMYRRVLAEPLEGGGRYYGYGDQKPATGLPGVSGLHCSVAAPILRAACTEMAKLGQELRELEPANGWGSYDGALKYLDRCATACERWVHIDHATFGVSW